MNLKSLFVVSVDDFYSTVDNEKYFLFQGSSNWDIYLTHKPKNIVEYEKLENIKLLSFEDKDNFSKKLGNINYIDYSIEHIKELNSYFILVENYEN